MSRGYIAIAQNSKVDYLKLAYALALSLKATQKENQFCVCVDEDTKSAMPDKYKEVFDYVYRHSGVQDVNLLHFGKNQGQGCILEFILNYAKNEKE